MDQWQVWRDWFFAKETLTWMFSGIGGLVLFTLCRWLFGKQRSQQIETASASDQTTITASDGSLSVSGDFTATAQTGGIVNVLTNNLRFAHFQSGS